MPTILTGRLRTMTREDTALLAQVWLRASGIPCRVDLRKSDFDEMNKVKVLVRPAHVAFAAYLLRQLLVEVRGE